MYSERELTIYALILRDTQLLREYTKWMLWERVKGAREPSFAHGQ